MKIDNETLLIMQNDIKTLVGFLKLDVNKLDVNDINNAWFLTWCNRTYDNNNRNVLKKENGERLLSFIDRENYDLYPCNTNDTTIYTALNKILKNLQNED